MHTTSSIHRRRRRFAGLAAGVLTGPLLVSLMPLPALADHSPSPQSVTLVGSLQSELGCAGDWQP
ncbi:hypothetical protein, partial [Arthrobacter sp.]|uniref:hypothetical protein n=1 Tax=Arthrobacter sp. TaxID=1667 RepID=UPI0028113A9C